MKKTMTIGLAFAGMMLGAQYKGVITDTMCGAGGHKGMNMGTDEQCVKACVKMDPNKYKYALTDGKNVWVLSDQKTPEKYAAKKVVVTGTLDEKTKTIKVDSIAPAK